jgi:hypothetical protein
MCSIQYTFVSTVKFAEEKAAKYAPVLDVWNGNIYNWTERARSDFYNERLQKRKGILEVLKNVGQYNAIKLANIMTL